MSEQTDLYRDVTDRILALLDQGIAPWHQPWSVEHLPQRNLHGFRPYQGFNRLLLTWAGYDSPYWLTRREAERRGWTVRDGERPWPVFGFFWPADRVPHRPVLVARWVFNLGQLDGVGRLPRPRCTGSRPAVPPVEAAEAVIRQMPRPPLIHEGGNVACYRPRLDEVRVPRRDRFESAEQHYATLFHELIHSTAHAQRVGRKMGIMTLLGADHDYSFEELVAELGAAFLCAAAGIAAATLETSAAYIDHWRRVLDTNPRWVVQAACQAEGAADYVLGTHPKALWPNDEEIRQTLSLVPGAFSSEASFTPSL